MRDPATAGRNSKFNIQNHSPLNPFIPEPLIPSYFISPSETCAMGFRQWLGPRPNSQAHPSRTPFPTCSMTTWPNLYFLQHPPTRIYPKRPYFQQACLKAFSKPDASHHSPRLPFSSLHSNPPPPAVNPTSLPPSSPFRPISIGRPSNSPAIAEIQTVVERVSRMGGGRS